jgi:hypothetical protein
VSRSDVEGVNEARHAGYTVAFETHDNAFPGFAIEAGCVVKTPARLMCVDAIKLSVDPPPPGAPPDRSSGRATSATR